MIKAPILVVERDNGEIFVYESEVDPRISKDIEPIDLRNGEYAFYDAEGRLLAFQVVNKKRAYRLFGILPINVERIEFAEAEQDPTHAEELRAALVAYFARSTSLESLQGQTLAQLVERIAKE